MMSNDAFINPGLYHDCNKQNSRNCIRSRSNDSILVKSKQSSNNKAQKNAIDHVIPNKYYKVCIRYNLRICLISIVHLLVYMIC